MKIFPRIGRATTWRMLAKTVSIDDAADRFLVLSRSWVDGPRKPAGHYVRQMLKFYTAVRIDDAKMFENDDILELSFDTDGPPLIDCPVDHRLDLSKDDYAEEDEFCFMLERRVFPSERPNAEPDDHTIGMKVYISFGTIASLRDSGALGEGVGTYNTEMSHAYAVGAYNDFANQPGVKKFLQQTPQSITAVVSPVG